MHLPFFFTLFLSLCPTVFSFKDSIVPSSNFLLPLFTQITTEPTVSVLQGPNGMATGFSQNPYDIPRGPQIPSHYDILPMRHSPTHTPPPPPESPSSLL